MNAFNHACFAFLSMMLLPVASFASGIGTVVAQTGEGVVIRGEQKVKLEYGLSIEQNDVIETSDTGIAEIEFTDRSRVTVGMGSQLTIDQFVYDPNAAAGNVSALSAGKGFFHFVSGKMAREKVAINTPVSTIGIRGTELAAEIGPHGKTLVSLVECCVDIQSQAGKSSLERIGTYVEVTTRRSAPTAPALTPDWWADKATAALGKSHAELGLEELQMPSYQQPDTTRPSHKQIKQENPVPSGPLNRKSFPSFEGSLIK